MKEILEFRDFNIKIKDSFIFPNDLNIKLLENDFSVVETDYKDEILNVLLGKFYDYKGDIIFLETSIKNLPQKFIHKRISYISSYNSFLSEMSVFENIELSVYFKNRDYIKNLFDYLKENNQINFLLYKKVKDLTDFEYERLMIIRAISRLPHLLIVDEILYSENIDFFFKNLSFFKEFNTFTILWLVRKDKKKILKKYCNEENYISF